MKGTATTKVLWFDTETSGLSPIRHGIIQIAGLIEIDNEIVDEFELTADPVKGHKELDGRALEINQYTAKEIITFGHPSTMKAQLHKIFDRWVDKFDKADKFIAAGYNVSFDVDFLRALWKSTGDNYFGSYVGYAQLDPISLVTSFIYRGIMKPLPDYKLTTVAEHLGIDTTDAHDALADIKMTREVMRTLCEWIG